MPGMSRAEIEAAIPHRPPFLWLDSVKELTENRLVATKEVSTDLDLFQGHYPHFPVLPGVIQCEMCFQAGAVLISKLQVVEAGQVPVVTRINNVKFRQMVRPGDTLEIEVELTERLQNAYYLNGKVSVGGKVSARLEFVCAAASVA